MSFCKIMGLFFVLMSSGAFPEENYIFKGQDFSLVQWDEIDPNEWLDYRLWMQQLALRESQKDWRIKLIEYSNNEKVAKVISCVGTCHLYKGAGKNPLRYKSNIYEGDEVKTDQESYLGLYTMDGGILFISPESSVTFNEINVSSEEVMILLRLNYGHISWIPRYNQTFPEDDLQETVAMFLPLEHPDSRIERTPPYYNENNLAGFISNPMHNLGHTKKANQKIIENLDIFKKSFLMVSMPNGTVISEHSYLEAFYKLGGHSFLRSRSPKVHFPDLEFETDVEFYFRGYGQLKKQKLNLNQTYRVDSRGRELNLAKKNYFAVTEKLTQRFPSFVIVRENWIREHSELVVSRRIKELDLARKYGYRLWDSMYKEKGDLYRRVDFLKQEISKTETTLLNTIDRYRNKYPTAKISTFEDFDIRFYRRFLDQYLSSLEKHGK